MSKYVRSQAMTVTVAFFILVPVVLFLWSKTTGLNALGAIVFSLGIAVLDALFILYIIWEDRREDRRIAIVRGNMVDFWLTIVRIDNGTYDVISESEKLQEHLSIDELEYFCAGVLFGCKFETVEQEIQLDQEVLEHE